MILLLRHPELDSGSMRFWFSQLRGDVLPLFKKWSKAFANGRKIPAINLRKFIGAKKLAHDENRRCFLLVKNFRKSPTGFYGVRGNRTIDYIIDWIPGQARNNVKRGRLWT